MDGEFLDTSVPSLLSEAEQDELVNKLVEHYDRFLTDVSPLHSKIDDWHKLYEAFTPEKKTFPWEGASNYRVPLVLSIIDSYHARLVKSVFEVDPLWITRARTPDGVESAYKAQWYLDYWSDQMDLPRTLDDSIMNMLIEGVGVIKVDFVSSEATTPTANAGSLNESAPQNILEYYGPEATSVPLKDFVLIPADAPTIDDAVYVGHRVFRTQQQLQKQFDAGWYENVDKLFEKSRGDSTSDRTAHPSSLVTASEGSRKSPEVNQYELVELYGPYEFDEGNPVPAIFTFSPKHKVLLRIEPYHYGYGRPPYIDFCIFPRANFFWGRSLAELLESSQDELTAIHNMRMDAVTRLVAPPILKKFGSRWDEEKDPLKPNSVITVSTPDEIMELQLREIPGSLFAHEQDLMGFVERATGMSDYSMGKMGNQYATATAVNRVTSEGLARVDVAISRYQMGLKRLAWFLWWLLYQYRPFMDYFYADSQHMTITKPEMRPATENGMMPFEIIPQGMLSDASKEAMRQQKLLLLQVVGQSQLPQYNPDGVRVLLDDVLKAFDVQNREDILGQDWNALQGMLQQAYMQGAQAGAAQGAQ